MTKLQVELDKAKARITRAVSKRIDCDDVTIGYNTWNITVHAWLKGDIIASWYLPINSTTKQVIQKVRVTEG